MKFKIRSKIIIMNIIVILPVIIIIYSMILRNLHGNLFSTSLNYLQKQSYSSQIYIINYVQKEMENNLKIDTILKNMSPFIAYYLEKDLKCQVQIIDKDMNVLGDSRDDSNFKLDEDVSNAVNGNKAYVIRKIGYRDYILFSSPIYINDKTVACVRYIYPLDSQNAIINKTFKVMIIVGVASLLVALFLSYFFSKRITKPLISLKMATEKVAKGDFTKVIEIESGDEIEELSNTFNIMSDSIEKYIQKLRNEKEKQKKFYDNITHELKTPLTSIIGYSNLIPRVESKEDIDRCSFYIEKEGKRLLDMIEELLYLSKINKTEFKLEKKECDIAKVIEESIAIMKPRLDKYCITVTKKINECNLLIDPLKVEEIFLNIIDNAIKYSECSEIEIVLEEKNKSKDVIIKDNGIGISKEAIKHVFNPFEDKNGLLLKSKGSSGLGLIICKQIMYKHCGIFKIESSEKTGTKIILSFNTING